VIVDSHVHVVSPDESAYPFSPRPLSGEWYREAPHSAEDLLALMDASGVDRAVLVQPVGAYSFDNRYTADSAARYKERFASACCVDVDAADPASELERWLGPGGMHGVRLFAIGADPAWIAEDRAAPLWRCAAAHGAHVIVTLLTPQLAELDTVLARHPEVSVSLDHCGFPPLSSAAGAGAEALFALAHHRNLHLKVSTHVLDAAEKLGDAREFVASLVARFGAERLMWGSDFCQTHDRSYAALVELGRRAFSDLPSAQRDLCLGGAALQLWPSLGEG
jgi:predicted TIM-barrel fold metal-dependent hydrolase